MTGTGSEPRFSVVVPAYNAAEFVEPCLKALLSAGFDTSEITLVDDGSTDGTSEIAEGLGVRVLRHPKPYGAAQALLFDNHQGVAALATIEHIFATRPGGQSLPFFRIVDGTGDGGAGGA